jgi:tungstate transport system ATP-binding protein
MAAVLAAAPDANLTVQGSGLAKSYSGRTVVSVEDIAVRDGEVFAILGPNGAGKSTLFRMLALIEKPDQGIVRHFGREVTVRDLSARRRTAAVFQRPMLFQGSVRNNVAYSLRLRRVPRKEVKSRVETALDLMSIGELAEADTRTLSGGELQRVALARALVLQPEILFLDEPTSNLDVHVRRSFREDIRSVVKRLGVTVVIITHDHNEALSLAQSVAVIRDGRIVQTGTPAEVFLRPADSFVAGFMGVETMWRGKVVVCAEGVCTICTEAGILADVVAERPPGSEVTVALRPEDVALATAPPVSGRPPSTSVRNHWQGVVDAVTPSGPLVRVSVRLVGSSGHDVCFGGEGEVVALITRASAEELELGPGVEVTASVKATALHVLGGSE